MMRNNYLLIVVHVKFKPFANYLITEHMKYTRMQAHKSASDQIPLHRVREYNKKYLSECEIPVSFIIPQRTTIYFR